MDNFTSTIRITKIQAEKFRNYGFNIADIQPLKHDVTY